MTSRGANSGSDTDTASRGRSRSRAELLRDALYLVFSAEIGESASLGWSLDDVTEARLGRAASGGNTRAERSAKTLKISISDPRMSSTHARLVRDLDRWIVEDQHSKNGLRVNGAVQTRALLTHGDVLETGHTFWVFGRALSGTEDGLVKPVELPVTPPLATFHPSLAEAFSVLPDVARSNVPVVIGGPSGTGKELVARAIHELSGRTGAFVPINCAALPPTLVESELFGYRKGAFTGALEDRPGLIRSADRGTLLLDEIGDLPMPAQAALLRVLQEGEVLPVGGSKPFKVDLRVIAATHRDLRERMVTDQFRADLFARLSGFSLRLPALEQRREDLGLLLSALLPRVSPGRSASISADAARALFSYEWPLNVRELEKALAVATVLARDGVVYPEHLPEHVRSARSTLRVPGTQAGLSPAERERRDQLLALLREHRGNISAIARVMGLARMQIQRWLKRYEIDPESFRE